jgi:hypothetical protein
MLAEERMVMSECTSLTRVTLTSHTRLRDKLDKTCKRIALRLHLRALRMVVIKTVVELADIRTADYESEFV